MRAVSSRTREAGRWPTLQNIDKVLVEIDIVQLARHQQALRDADLPDAQLGLTEEPVLPAHRDGVQGALVGAGQESLPDIFFDAVKRADMFQP